MNMITRENRSKSNPSAAPYLTQVDTDTGNASCTCRGFYMQKLGKPRECSHTKALVKECIQGVAPTPPPAPNIVAGATEPNTGFCEPMKAMAIVGELTWKMVDGMKVPLVPAQYMSSDYVMEPKMDGHRITVRVNKGQSVVAYSGKAKRRELPREMVESLGKLRSGEYDGELHVFGGTSSDVTRLDKQAELRFVVFDVLEVDSAPQMSRSYGQRRATLKAVMEAAGPLDRVDLIPVMKVTQDNVDMLWKAGAEGAIIKRVASTYQPGSRGSDWVKLKRLGHMVVTITGFKSGKNGPVSTVEFVQPNGIAGSVKTLNNEHLALFGMMPMVHIGRKLVITYIELMASGKLRHAMFDHLASTSEAK